MVETRFKVPKLNTVMIVLLFVLLVILYAWAFFEMNKKSIQTDKMKANCTKTDLFFYTSDGPQRIYDCTGVKNEKN